MSVFATDLFRADLFVAGLFAGSVPAVSPNITTAVLPDGVVSEPYSQQFEATGVTPLSWSLESGSLPLGLGFTAGGLLSGTPRQVESAAFLVRVVNSEGTDTQALTLDINAAAALELGDDYGFEQRREGSVDYLKTPDEIIIVPFDWASRLEGATIVTPTFELPDGLASEDETQDGTLTEIRISGGTASRTYRVIGKVTDSESRLFEQVKRVLVEEG